MRHRNCKGRILVMPLIAFLAAASVCSSNQKEVNELSKKLQTLVEGMIDAESEYPIHNAVLFVECSKIKWKGAAGMADGKEEAMTANHKIKIASIGKTFTATVVLQLVEEGRLNLDDPIGQFLDNPAVNLDSLHIYKGIAYGPQITVKQLLNHTSGIADYMEDPRFIPDVLKYPRKEWSSSKILEKYYEYQTNEKAICPPGKGFNYSDVNYVLLAMIIEQVTGDTYHGQLESRIFSPLGMHNSYLEHYEEARGSKPLSHAFLSTIDLVTEVNTSMDWGGGGIVSTCEELNAFFRALVDGKLFRKESTLRQMIAEADKGRGGSDYDYGLGIMKRSLCGLTFYGHGGAYDCDVYYCPERNISVCLSLNQMETLGKRDEFLLQAIKLIM